jgi:chemosensory pili system protein ChpA (sensor histidine kinase/response regulator)
MADSGTTSDLASQSLDLVSRELNSTLEAAHAEIEDYVEGHANEEALLRAAGMLHLASGALKIVEIHGAALLAEEMEQTCRALTELEDSTQVERGVEALTRAMVQLPAYLERLLSGGRDVALVLLPLLNDLRKVRKKPLLSEGTVLLLNTGPLERAPAPKPQADFGHELQSVAQRLRPVFQTALLGWIRGEKANGNLDSLIKASTMLGQSATAEAVKQFWSVLGGVLIGLRLGGLESGVALKRLMGQADRQLKRLMDVGEAAFANAPPVELQNSLLYYVARAQCEDPRLTQLRDKFGLKNAVPGEAQLERAREGLSGPSVKLMKTVAQAIKEDLTAVKDVLDIFVRTGMSDIAQITPQIEMLKKIGDTLGVLGLDSARNQIQNETQRLSVIVVSNTVEDPRVLEQVAATLLDVEDALDRELVRAVVPGQSDGESEAKAQYRHVTQAVMNECIVNLAKIKEVVIKIVDDSGSVRSLDQVKPQLRGITAGLLMLNKTKAASIMDRIGVMIATRLATRETPMRPEHLERLADAVVSVEYFMETVSLGRTDPTYMLENAERCLDLLERLPVPKAAARPKPAPPPVAPEPEVPPSVMEVHEDRSNPELVEVFIEEAKEELANIQHYLPVWTENLENTEALITIRRSFHTLKGSGRMVGAQLLGEFAWTVENLLNRLINQTLEPTSAMLAFIGEAANSIPALIEQLEIGIAPRFDIHVLMKRAEAFAEGDPDAGNLTSESIRVEALSDQEAGASRTGMDPVLTEIFVKEMRGHLDTIRAFVGTAQAHSPPHLIDEPLYRACHTLLGSARMANCQPAIAYATPLDDHLGAHYEAESGLTSEGLRVLQDLIETMAGMADTLADGGEPDTDLALVERLAGLAPAAAAEPEQDEASREPAPAPEVVRQDPGFDPEIAAIFSEEAVEILEQAEIALQDFEGHVDPSSLLSELQRLLHTLKGGARMAGVMAMGNLSHALETLVEGMSSGRVASDSAALDLVQRCLDQLHHMRDSIDAGQGVENPAALVAEIDALAAGAPLAGAASQKARAIPEPEGAAVPAPASPESASPAAEAATEPEVPLEPAGAVEPGVAEVASAASVGAASKPAPAQPATASTAARQPSAKQAAVDASAPGIGTAEPEPQVAEAEGPAAAAPRSSPERVETARVEAELLDLLLNSAGEINIFQSRLNQQLHSVEFHLGELGETVTRLREQLRNLEAETEAQILHRHQEEGGDDSNFDPLELDRYSTIQQLSRALAETSNDVASINELLYGLTTEAGTLLTQQSRVTTELQDGLMQTRMVSFQRHVARLARIVRQISADTGKSAELVVDGAHSELDRQVLESILPALEHLLRNSVVHGLERPAARREAGKAETGTVTLKLRREGSEVLIEVSDDGAGLNLDAIRRKALELRLVSEQQQLSDADAMEFILRPGFSTAGKLTQSAGRGVGMDVVDTEVKKLGGSMRIESERGAGTRFLIRLPYTLAITHALIVNVGDETFALPLPTVEGITRVRREQLLDLLTQDEPRLEYGGVNYRIQHLGSLVGSAPSALPDEENAVSLVLVRAGENSTALLTDSLEGSREIVVKTLGPHLASVPGVSGATILGDGRIIAILDAGTLVRSQHGASTPAQVPVQVEKQLTALVVDDSITMRRVTERLLERRGVKVLTARDGLDAISVLQEHEADIILLDIEMPRMDGYQFASHVRNDARVKDLPIIMITSRSGEKHRAKAIEVGVNDYLSKPYQEAQLVGAMENLLGRAI